MTPIPPHRPNIQRDYGTYTAYLEASKNKHNGLGVDDLLNRIELGVPWTKIAEDFNVRAVSTIKVWYKAILSEKAK